MLIDIMHTITNVLQGPVIVVLMALAVLMVVIVGMLIAEFFTERRYFKLSVPELVDDLQSSPDPEAVIRGSGMLRRQKSALFELLAHPSATPLERESMAVNIVAQEQSIFDNRVKVTDFISKVGPMLGLMGTLIPLGPGVIAIGEGDTQTLSTSLLVAFDTTIMGLLVAALALLVSTIRKAWYAKYNAAFEAACEVVLEKANEGAALSGYAAQPSAVAQPQPAAQPQQAAPPSAGDATGPRLRPNGVAQVGMAVEPLPADIARGLQVPQTADAPVPRQSWGAQPQSGLQPPSGGIEQSVQAAQAGMATGNLPADVVQVLQYLQRSQPPQDAAGPAKEPYHD